MMPIRREDTAKMGTRSLSPLRGRPLAKTRYFQGSRNRARKRTCHLHQTADSGPVPNAQVICKKSWRIGHRSADLISAAAHVPARAYLPWWFQVGFVAEALAVLPARRMLARLRFGRSQYV